MRAIVILLSACLLTVAVAAPAQAADAEAAPAEASSCTGLVLAGGFTGACTNGCSGDAYLHGTHIATWTC